MSVWIVAVSLAAQQDVAPPPAESEYISSGIGLNSVGYGSLHLRSQSPFHILRPSLLPSIPSTLARGQFEFGQTVTWTNLWAVDPGLYLIDMEVVQATTILRYGLVAGGQNSQALLSSGSR